MRCQCPEQTLYLRKWNLDAYVGPVSRSTLNWLLHLSCFRYFSMDITTSPQSAKVCHTTCLYLFRADCCRPLLWTWISCEKSPFFHSIVGTMLEAISRHLSNQHTSTRHVRNVACDLLLFIWCASQKRNKWMRTTKIYSICRRLHIVVGDIHIHVNTLFSNCSDVLSSDKSMWMPHTIVHHISFSVHHDSAWDCNIPQYCPINKSDMTPFVYRRIKWNIHKVPFGVLIYRFLFFAGICAK